MTVDDHAGLPIHVRSNYMMKTLVVLGITLFVLIFTVGCFNVIVVALNRQNQLADRDRVEIRETQERIQRAIQRGMTRVDRLEREVADLRKSSK